MKLFSGEKLCVHNRVTGLALSLLWGQQSGAGEACRARNPEGDGSKPSSAKHLTSPMSCANATCAGQLA